MPIGAAIFLDPSVTSYVSFDPGFGSLSPFAVMQTGPFTSGFSAGCWAFPSDAAKTNRLVAIALIIGHLPPKDLAAVHGTSGPLVATLHSQHDIERRVRLSG